MPFENLQKWLARRSLKQFICLLLSARIIDAAAAFLVSRFRPELFFKYEFNLWTRAAFYYGELWKLLIPWAIFFGLILLVVVPAKFLGRPIILDSILVFLLFYTLATAFTNIRGLILGSITPENTVPYIITDIIYLLINGTGVIFIIFGFMWQS